MCLPQRRHGGLHAGIVTDQLDAVFLDDLAADEVRAFVADHPEDGPASSAEPA